MAVLQGQPCTAVTSAAEKQRGVSFTVILDRVNSVSATLKPVINVSGHITLSFMAEVPAAQDWPRGMATADKTTCRATKANVKLLINQDARAFPRRSLSLPCTGLLKVS